MSTVLWISIGICLVAIALGVGYAWGWQSGRGDREQEVRRLKLQRDLAIAETARITGMLHDAVTAGEALRVQRDEYMRQGLRAVEVRE